jgi:hypothetical protein
MLNNKGSKGSQNRSFVMIKCFNKYIFKENFIKEFIKEGGMKSMIIQHLKFNIQSYIKWFVFSAIGLDSLSCSEMLK